MNIDFEVSLPVKGMTVEEIKHYRRIHYYMSNNKCLDKIVNKDLTMFDLKSHAKIQKQIKLQYLSKLFPESVKIYNQYEHIAPKPQNKRAIAVVGVSPMQDWAVMAEFAIHDYDIFFICDKEFTPPDYPLMATNKKNVHFVHISKDICRSMNYVDISHAYSDVGYLGTANSNQASLREKIGNCGGWEKTLFYFSQINLNYEHIWFLEDDCMLFSQDGLCRFDNWSSERDSDWLTAAGNEGFDDGAWYIQDAMKKYDKLPQYPREEWKWALVRTCRTSRRNMQYIYKHFKNHKRGFFIEVFFPTVAGANKLKLSTLLPTDENKDVRYWINWAGKPINLCYSSDKNTWKWDLTGSNFQLVYHHQKNPHFRMDFVRMFLHMHNAIHQEKIFFDTRINWINDIDKHREYIFLHQQGHF
jgi:hypothetical protein